MNILGIDLGGTNIRAGMVQDGQLSGMITCRIDPDASYNDMLQLMFDVIDSFKPLQPKAIGIGVPGLVDQSSGVVFDVVNIPSWKEIPLQHLLQSRYKLPVIIDNDANCFALGEFYFGKGKGSLNMVGLTIGTGLGTGIIIHEKLYAGKHGGAGEFGMIDYKDHCYEYYASGQFFSNVYGIDGEQVFAKAKAADPVALKMYEALGAHVGNAIKMIIYALDINTFILGGSVSKAFPYFSGSVWQQVQTFAYKRSIEQLRIEVSALENSGILGASALALDRGSHFNTPAN